MVPLPAEPSGHPEGGGVVIQDLLFSSLAASWGELGGAESQLLSVVHGELIYPACSDLPQPSHQEASGCSYPALSCFLVYTLYTGTDCFLILIHMTIQLDYNTHVFRFYTAPVKGLI